MSKLTREEILQDLNILETNAVDAQDNEQMAKDSLQCINNIREFLSQPTYKEGYYDTLMSRTKKIEEMYTLKGSGIILKFSYDKSEKANREKHLSEFLKSNNLKRNQVQYFGSVFYDGGSENE